MWTTWRRDLFGLAAVVALAAVGMAGRVPLLSHADLGFHELGHLVCYALDAALPWPEIATAAAGSVTQVGVPLGLAASFALRRNDRVGAAVCSAWAATALADVGRYIADAPHQALPLIGGEHDWAAILGPEHLDRLDLAAPLARAAQAGGWALVAAAVVLTLAPMARWAWGPTATARP